MCFGRLVLPRAALSLATSIAVGSVGPFSTVAALTLPSPLGALPLPIAAVATFALPVVAVAAFAFSTVSALPIPPATTRNGLLQGGQRRDGWSYARTEGAEAPAGLHHVDWVLSQRQLPG